MASSWVTSNKNTQITFSFTRILASTTTVWMYHWTGTVRVIRACSWARRSIVQPLTRILIINQPIISFRCGRWHFVELLSFDVKHEWSNSFDYLGFYVHCTRGQRRTWRKKLGQVQHLNLEQRPSIPTFLIWPTNKERSFNLSRTRSGLTKCFAVFKWL